MSASHYQELGHPHIQTCLPGTHTYINQFNSIVRSDDGFIFIGARNGILGYNGSSWSHITVNGDYHLLNHGKLILAWSATSIGFLRHSPGGVFEYIPGDDWTRGQILRVLSDSAHLYISTAEALYRMDDESPPVQIDHLPEHLDIPSGESLAGAPIGYGLPSGVITSTGQLSTGQQVFGTSDGGILLLSPDSAYLRRITAEEGLYSNDVRALMTDASNNLWVLHEHALSRIELPSAFSFFNSYNGISGNNICLIRFEDELYAGGSRGLYRLSPQKDPESRTSSVPWFTKIEEIASACRCLEGMASGLAAGTEQGLFIIRGEEATQLTGDPVNDLYFNSELDLLVAGTDRGLRMFKQGTWEEVRDFSLPEISFDDIALSPDGYLWLSSRTGSIYRSAKTLNREGNLTYTSYKAEDLESPPGTYIKLIRIKNRLLFSGTAGLSHFDPVSGKFQPYTDFRLPLPEGSYRIRDIVEALDHSIWITIDPEVTSTSIPSGVNERIWIAPPSEDREFEFQPFYFSRLNKRFINCLLTEGTATSPVFWIGTDDGIVRFDPALKAQGPNGAKVLITGIHLPGKDPLTYSDFPAKLKRKNNNLRFEFLSNNFNCAYESEYRYSLSGSMDKWTDWGTRPYAEFDRLKSGPYVFLVQSRDINGKLSQSDEIAFRIRVSPFSSWYAILLYVLVVLVAGYYFHRWLNLRQLREQYHLEEVVQERTESLIQEKEKAENLLANILPKSTADELKSTGKASSSKFKMCTVLFADIQGFTRIAEEMDADKLIDQLDKFYFQFDSVVEKFNIEKIKTIGDAYMAAGGIPIKNRTNPVEVVLAALEMQHYMKELKKEKTDIWDLRIGIHTGSVIAGVVGQKKYSYDIWGDTVNTASRMESSGEAGRVNISATTYKLIKDFFQCEFRGKMPVKYKGDIAMFFVNGLNPTYLEDDRITPNPKFFIQIQLLRLLDLEEFIIERLEKELPEDLYFHNVEHTSHVYAQVELLGRGEKIGDEDLLLLRTAALLHDMGYIDGMDGHEQRSVEYAKEILPLYRYSEEQIDRVGELILATTMPPDPKNLLEQIICDANLDHLGRIDFLIQSDKLFQEYRMRHKIKSKKDWNQYQISLLESHEFYTDVANKMREVPKEQQIEQIRQFS